MYLYLAISIYLLIINSIAFIFMYNDKSRAKKNQRRIPEKTLFKTAWLGGAIGAILGMQTFRHKTKHPSFTIGMPAIFILQVIVVFALFSVYSYYLKS